MSSNPDVLKESTVLNTIETAKRYLKKNVLMNDEFSIDNMSLYQKDFGQNLGILLSTLHELLNNDLDELNSRIGSGNNHYLAESSRRLLFCIETIKILKENSDIMSLGFHLDEKYDDYLKACEGFLVEFGGSLIPDDLSKIQLYYSLPIFKLGQTTLLPNKKSSIPLRPIGNGSYADVFSYYDKAYDKVFALKKAKKNISPKDLERFKREFQILKELSNPYIIEVYRFDDVNNQFTMELADVSLLDYIQKNNSKLTFKERRQLCLQIIKIFSYLEEKDIMHRDIAPNNFLLKFYDNMVVVKIADFGLVKPNESNLTSMGTEVRGSFNDETGLDKIGFENYDRRFEYFALTKLMYFILTGRNSNMNKFRIQGLQDFYDKGTSLDFEQRFDTIAEFKEYFMKISG